MSSRTSFSGKSSSSQSSRHQTFWDRSALGLATLVALGLAAAQPAQAQIAGFGTGAGFTLNHGGDATHTGDGGDSGNPASITAGVLTITDNNNSEANSAIYNTKQNITNWNAAFTYTDVGGATGGANGFTFFLENAPQGTAALGGRGSGMGYGNDDSGNRTPNYIADSAAIAFNVYTSGGQTAGTTFLTAGAAGTAVGGTFTGTAPVNLQSGNPILVNLSYDGTTLSEKLTDGANVYTTSYATNLATVVGGNTAYVGFGGGTGGFNVNQTISGFSFTPAPEPSQSAALGIGLLGLGVLVFRARRRSADAS